MKKILTICVTIIFVLSLSACETTDYTNNDTSAESTISSEDIKEEVEEEKEPLIQEYMSVNTLSLNPILNEIVSILASKMHGQEPCAHTLSINSADKTFEINVYTISLIFEEVLGETLKLAAAYPSDMSTINEIKSQLSEMPEVDSDLGYAAGVVKITGSYSEDGEYLDCKIKDKSLSGFTGEGVTSFRLYKTSNGYEYLGETIGTLYSMTEFCTDESSIASDGVITNITVKYKMNINGKGNTYWICVDGIKIQEINWRDTAELTLVLPAETHTFSMQSDNIYESDKIDFAVTKSNSSFDFTIAKGGFGGVNVELEQ